MRKTISIILVIVMILTAFPAASFISAAEEPEENTVSIVFDGADDTSRIRFGGAVAPGKRGDLNGDTAINIMDLRLLKQYIACGDAEISRYGADVNGDGAVTIKDCLALKKILAGVPVTDIFPQAVYFNSAGSNSAEFDAEEEAARVTASSGTRTMSIVPDELANGFDAGDYRYAGVVVKADADIEAASVYGLTSSAAEKKDFNVSSDGKYHLKLFDMNELSDWNGAKSAFSLDLPDGFADGSSLLFDSFIMTNSLEALESFAAEREQIRNSPELNIADGNPDEVGENDAYDILFSDQNSIALLKNPFHASFAFNASANCVSMTVSSEKTDPQVYLDLEDLNLSAEAYKYVVYTYKVPTTIKKADPDAELFMCAGNIAVPTADHSKMFSLTKDGAFHSQIIDMNSETYWTGKIHGIRLDFFCDAFAGDISFVKSVVLCRSLAAAQMAAARMSGASGGSYETGLDAKNVADIFKGICTKDSTGNGYIRLNGAGEPTVCFTGGTHARFTKAHLESRFASLITSSAGSTCTVEIAEEWNEMKADYDSTDRTDRYAVVKVKKDGAFCIMFTKIDFTMKKVIFDHDLGPDCDDAGAISMVAKAHRDGYINCIAITSCIYNDFSAYAAAAIVDYLGLLGEIRIGTNRRRMEAGGGVRCCQTPAKNYWNTHGPWPTLEDDVNLLRDIFSSNGKKDITFITTGPISTLYMLFNSGADSYSDLSGRDLFINNVKLYVCGGGNFENNYDIDHNLEEDNAAAVSVINNLTEVQMIFCGGELAGNIYTGGVLASCDNYWVVKGCYYYQNYETGNYARNSWDMATTSFAVYGGAGMWEVVNGYNISVYTNGTVIVSPGGNRSYLVKIASDGVIAGFFSRSMVPN